MRDEQPIMVDASTTLSPMVSAIIPEVLRDDLIRANRELAFSRRLSYVPRWSVVPTIRQQSVAEHSFHVTRIAQWLTQFHAEGGDVGFYSTIMKLALIHDDEEAKTGDYPSTTKVPRMPSDQVNLVVKIADKLEALVFLAEEEAMGNSRVKDIMEHIRFKIHDLWTAFQWRENWDSPNAIRKPIASDMIRMVVQHTTRGHPALEGYRG